MERRKSLPRGGQQERRLPEAGLTFSWSAGHKRGSAQFNILEGFLEEAQLQVSNPHEKAGPRLEIQWGRAILTRTQLELEVCFGGSKCLENQSLETTRQWRQKWATPK